jgi:hypothetical protein
MLYLGFGLFEILGFFGDFWATFFWGGGYFLK